MSIYKMRTEFGHILKPILILIALVFLVGGIYSFGVAPSKGPGGSQGGNDVIATVNGSDITRSEYDSVWASTEEMLRDREMRSPLAYADMRAMVLQNLIQSRQILSAAQQMGVDVSDNAVDAEVEKAVTQALNLNRAAVLGKMSKERAQTDPRDDREYKSQLASIGTSISQQEDYAKSKVSVEQIRANLARQGIEAKLRSQVKPVTDADIIASYNTYRIRQIGLAKGKLPDAQFKTRVDKIVSEARSGGDFAKLARDNSEAPGKGAVEEMSFQNRTSFPPDVREAVAKLKPGEVSPPINTPYATFIVKLESVTPTMPAKLDDKAKTARRREIQSDREMALQSAFAQRLATGQNIKVIDPELLGYWNMSEARQSMSNPAEYKRKMKLAIAALIQARKVRPNNYIAACKLADLLYQDGQVDKAISVLYPMLEGANVSVEGADVRMLLGDMLLKKGETDKAIEQYKIASEEARNDPGLHEQLVIKYQQLKQPELVASENQWLADYQVRLAQSKALQGNAPGGRPMPVQPAPRPGE